MKRGHTTSSPKECLLAPLGSDLRLNCKKRMAIHQLKKEKEKEKKKETQSNNKPRQTDDQKKKKRKEALPFSLSLSTGSFTVFYLLRVRLEGPRGDWGVMSRDPKEHWLKNLQEPERQKTLP